MGEKQSKLCIAGYVLGIVGLCTSVLAGLGAWPSLVGIILSIICLVKKRQPKSKARAGLIMSIIGYVMSTFFSV